MNAALISSCVFFIALMGIHAVFLRFWGSTLYVSRSLKLFLCFIAMDSVDRLRRGSFDFEEIFTVWVTVGLLWSFYMVVMVNLMNSVSFRMMRTLRDASEGRLQRKEFDRFFSEDLLLNVRLELLKKNQLIQWDPGSKISLTASGERLAKLFWYVQRVFRFKKVG